MIRKAANKTGLGNLVKRSLPSSADSSSPDNNNDKHDLMSGVVRSKSKSKLNSWKRAPHRPSHSTPTLTTGYPTSDEVARAEKADKKTFIKNSIIGGIDDSCVGGSGGSVGIAIEKKISIQSTSATPDSDEYNYDHGRGRDRHNNNGGFIGGGGSREFDWGFRTFVG